MGNNCKMKVGSGETEQYNGTSWTEVADLLTARSMDGVESGVGTTTSRRLENGFGTQTAVFVKL